MRRLFFMLGLTLLLGACSDKTTTDIPLAEHPRPDFQRTGFINLNGTWNFTFSDSLAASGAYDKTITVPFSWGSKLSGVDDGGDVAWYSRSITVPNSWKGKKVFLVIGACDWKTDVSLNGTPLGSHTGGYTPFEFEITDLVDFGGSDTLSIKVDDTYSDAHLYGKQGYGNARGIWQTPYLEARGNAYISQIHFIPDIDSSSAVAEITTCGATDGETVTVSFRNGEYKPVSSTVADNHARVEIPMPDQHLWTIDDPYLYEVTVSLTDDDVDSYFGQRKISTVTVPGQDYTYVALNNKPIYLKLCLDQSYHPDGYYTFPSDEFMKQEIMLSKKLGLNGNRVHIKAEIPRKLYWADKLGLLIMADIPCYFGPANDEAKTDWEYCMRNQIARDFNHPSIFSWVNFNETWGLYSMEGDKKLGYTKDVQEWVRDMYLLAKSLDPTRLIEDNSACNHDHVQTDINSWHAYLPNYRWEETDSIFEANTYPGSSYNFTEGNTQTGQPMINSECGNVWGYNGNAGDCDYTWDYHEMMNAFHRHPKIAGWLYTEHHDVINEWNGYVRYDRSAKDDGLYEFIDGMEIKDLHSDYYIVPSEQFYSKVKSGSVHNVKLLSSFTTDRDPGKMTLETVLSGWRMTGLKKMYDTISFPVEFKPFQLAEVAERKVSIPEENGVYELSYVLKDSEGNVLHRNFSLFAVTDGKSIDNSISLNYSDASWTVKQTSILDGKKIDGFGSGWFEFIVDIPASFDAENHAAHLLFEASSNKLFGKDIDDNVKISGEFHLGQGTFDPCKSSNSYSMTDTYKWTSKVQVSVNGRELGIFNLEDNPADHRGTLSWISQPHDMHMYEPGSYGYLIDVAIPAGTLKTGKATIRLTVPESAVSDTSGGLAIYGKEFGRYPLDPTIVFE